MCLAADNVDPAGLRAASAGDGSDHAGERELQGGGEGGTASAGGAGGQLRPEESRGGDEEQGERADDRGDHAETGQCSRTDESTSDTSRFVASVDVRQLLQPSAFLDRVHILPGKPIKFHGQS